MSNRPSTGPERLEADASPSSPGKGLLMQLKAGIERFGFGKAAITAIGLAHLIEGDEMFKHPEILDDGSAIMAQAEYAVDNASFEVSRPFEEATTRTSYATPLDELTYTQSFSTLLA